ncbi:MAG: hypothetical protein Q9218_003597 [Villophora microphyllina]
MATCFPSNCLPYNSTVSDRVFVVAKESEERSGKEAGLVSLTATKRPNAVAPPAIAGVKNEQPALTSQSRLLQYASFRLSYLKHKKMRLGVNVRRTSSPFFQTVNSSVVAFCRKLKDMAKSCFLEPTRLHPSVGPAREEGHSRPHLISRDQLR